MAELNEYTLNLERNVSRAHDHAIANLGEAAIECVRSLGTLASRACQEDQLLMCALVSTWPEMAGIAGKRSVRSPRPRVWSRIRVNTTHNCARLA